MSTATGRIEVTRRIEAPARLVFGVIADPAQHPSYDGTGMVRDGTGNEVVGAVGDGFRTRMHNDDMGDYEMENLVVAFEQDRHIAWEPMLVKAGREEDENMVGNRAGHRWGYELTDTGEGATDVTAYFDCSAAPEWLRRVLRDGERWRDPMATSLDRLAKLAEQGGQQ
jgi:uncharacterized protein YndB with AHSA1/START domain